MAASSAKFCLETRTVHTPSVTKVPPLPSNIHPGVAEHSTAPTVLHSTVVVVTVSVVVVLVLVVVIVVLVVVVLVFVSVVLVPSVFGPNLQCELVRKVDTREECH
jgi:hypothetical protein